MFSNIGISELLVILAIVLIIFGPNKLPEFSKALAKSIRVFKEELNTDKPKKNKKYVG